MAETALLHAAELARQGQTDRALDLCRAGTDLLRQLRSGTDPGLLAPCRATYAAEAAQRPTDSQRLLAAMFETAELAQDSLTTRQIAEAAARLAANAHDPKVAEAIRRRQDAGQTLAELFRERDALARGALPGTVAPPAVPVSPADLDKHIAAAQADLADADAALHAAAPNYGQLVQEVVPAGDVLAALRPGEAFVAITLTGDAGWVFLLRDGQIDAAPMRVGTSAVADLVRRVRAGIELTTAGLPRFDTDSAHALYEAVLGPIAPKLAGAKALVVAPSGALLSLPFAVLLTGTRRSRPAGRGSLADPRFHPRARPVGGEFRGLATDRGDVAGDAAVVRVRRFPPGDVGPGRAQLPGRGLRRQRPAIRRPAAPALRPAGTGGGASLAGRVPVG